MHFEHEHPLLLAFWRLCLLRLSPEDLPASPFLLTGLIVINFLLGVVCFLIQHDLSGAILRVAADLLITLGIVTLLLIFALRIHRIMQTLIAVSGTSMILNVFSVPLLFLLPPVGAGQSALALLLTLLFIWQVFVMGGIFRHAFTLSLPAGILLSIVSIMLALSLFYMVFPQDIRA